MSKTYKIKWADWTWSPTTGCTAVSPACDHCYARRLSKRFAGRYGYPLDDPFRVTVHYDRLIPDLQLRQLRKRQFVFVVSMGDLFHGAVPDEVIQSLFVTFREYSQHTYMLLTKRPERMREIVPRQPLENVWMGVTAENQEMADYRIPILLDTPAALHFVSVEPMLEPVTLKPHFRLGWSFSRENDRARIDLKPTRIRPAWIICGGETGRQARKMEVEWARALRDECKEAGVPFFFKQMSQGYITPPDLRGLEQHPGRQDGR